MYLAVLAPNFGMSSRYDFALKGDPAWDVGLIGEPAYFDRGAFRDASLNGIELQRAWSLNVGHYAN
jgi:hypothetical protein